MFRIDVRHVYFLSGGVLLYFVPYNARRIYQLAQELKPLTIGERELHFMRSAINGDVKSHHVSPFSNSTAAAKMVAFMGWPCLVALA